MRANRSATGNALPWALLVAGLLLMCFSATVAAEAPDEKASLKCEEYWTGPDADNSVMDCVSSRKAVDGNANLLVPPGLAAVTLILWLFAFPTLFLCFCCCKCCSCCAEVPAGEARKESSGNRTYLTLTTVIVLALAGGSLVVMIVGAANTQQGLKDIFAFVTTKTIAYFKDLSDDLKSTLSDGSGGYVEPLQNDTFTVFDDTMTSIQDESDNIYDMLQGYSDIATKVSYGVAAFPVILIALAVVFNFCSCRKCLPSCCSCFFWLIGGVFAIIAIVLFVCALALSIINGEIIRGRNEEPGLITWWGVPNCDKVANFTELKDSINTAETDNAYKFCEAMLGYCDGNPTYDPIGAQDKLFYCNITNGTDCPTFQAASVAVNVSYAKAGTGVCNASNDNCSFRECATDCVNATLRDPVADAIKLLDFANKALKAFHLIEPILDCQFLIGKLLLPFDGLPTMKNGVWLIAAGFCAFSFLLFVSAIIMLRGSQLWFSDSEMNEEADPDMLEDREMNAKQPS